MMFRDAPNAFVCVTAHRRQVHFAVFDFTEKMFMVLRADGYKICAAVVIVPRCARRRDAIGMVEFSVVHCFVANMLSLSVPRSVETVHAPSLQYNEPKLSQKYEKTQKIIRNIVNVCEILYICSEIGVLPISG